MLKRYGRKMKLYAPADHGLGDFIGYYPVSMSYRTSEEVESGDMLYVNHRYSAYCNASRAPESGFVRGMTLVGEGGEHYHVLSPVLAGRLWVMKVQRVLLNGEEESYGRVQGSN